ncbi:MAG: hypothetical protein JNK82_20970, partial [Myxococcaceae bacterium]|nr:hypothetical protein [Myxococcaceae bacterium]
ELDLGGGASPGFAREAGEEWQASISFKHVDPTGFVPMVTGKYRIVASGTVQLVSAGDGDVKDLIGTTMAPGTFPFRLKCVAPGVAAVVLTMWSDAIEQQAVYAGAGLCRLPLLAEVALPMTAPRGPRSEETRAAVTEAIELTLSNPPAAEPPNLLTGIPFALAQVYADRLSHTFDDLRPAITAQFKLACTRCPVQSGLTGSVELANAINVGIEVHRHTATAQSPVAFALEPAFAEPVAVGAIGVMPVVFDCQKSGVGRIDASFSAHNGSERSWYVARDSAMRPGVVISCDDGTTKNDDIMLADNTQLSRNNDSWVSAAGTGLTANVIQAHDDVLEKSHPIAPGGRFNAGIARWRSNVKWQDIVLRTQRQTATARHNGTSYTFTGLTAGPAFDDVDTVDDDDDYFEAQAVPASGPPVTETLIAPPPLSNVNTAFGAPQGFDTVITLPEGTFDTLYVYLVLRPPGTPEGEFSVALNRPASSLQRVGGNRVAPLVDGPALPHLRALGWPVRTVYVAYFNTVLTSKFFDGRAVPMRAGRMWQFTGADLRL